MTLSVTSAAFSQEQPIPRRFTGDGDDVSPPLRWSAPPGGTRSWVLIVDDPDAPKKTWVHWVVFNVPADSRGLQEAFPAAELLPDGTARASTTSATSATEGQRRRPASPTAISSSSSLWIAAWIYRPRSTRPRSRPRWKVTC
jgi:Raf kinase inhibitor-like YbhB/YbcL family protein